jgi:hypothetical protein
MATLRNDLIGLLNLKELVGGPGFESLFLSFLIEMVFAVILRHGR